MRRPRFRLREFFLLVALASLVAASLAIRARTARQEAVRDHAFRAHRARIVAESRGEQVEWARWRLEVSRSIAEDWPAGCDLRLIPSVTGAGDMPAEGRNLVVVAVFYDSLWFRIFDGDGRLVVDHVAADQPGVGAFKKRLSSLWPPHEITRAEKDRVISAVTMFVNDYRAAMQAGLKGAQAKHAEAIAEAERLERLARRP